MNTIMNGKITKIVKETEDAVSVYFEPDMGEQGTFSYLPGQYITLIQQIDGEEIRRAYSLCTSPYTDKTPAVSIKKVEGGRMSQWANTKLKVGDTIQFLAPEGRFTPTIDPANKKQYILVAGGSGITPIMSILKSVLTQEKDSVVSLIYANRNKNSVIFKSDLEQWQKNYADRLEWIPVYDSGGLFYSGYKGPLKAETMKKILAKVLQKDKEQLVFICGPGGMMEAAKAGLENSSIAAEAIHIEYFVAPGNTNNKNEKAASNTVVAEAEVSMKLHGSFHTFKVSGRKTILAGAQDAGFDPPYSCESGICSTCMAKVTEGSVTMIENNILTNKEVEAGFVLTCQALCTSDKVKVEFFE